jgi:hypothetical protein
MPRLPRPWLAAIALIVAATLAPSPIAFAGEAPAAAPLRVYLDCQRPGRTKACPTFLRGFLDESPLLAYAPRAAADVVLYVNATSLASDDRLHLRFVGSLPGAPPAIEITTVIDSRSADDAQRARLRPAFLRGLALFVAARHPDAVTVELAAPAAPPAAPADTTPWGAALSIGGFGSWTEDYGSFNGWSSLEVSRIEPRSKLAVSVGADAGVTRQPSLLIDGQEISLDSDAYALSAGASGARHLSDHWALGASLSALRQDPEGQYRHRFAADAGVEWDRYAADDPRGNKLAVGYQLGYDVESYNVRNQLGERRAHFPVHELFAQASVRKDQVSYGLYLSAWSELVHPGRRHRLSASPSLSIQLGAHVDLSLSLSVTRREVPGPAELDPGNFEQISRASYAQPLSLYGSFGLRLHWERTNGARNDRFGGGG